MTENPLQPNDNKRERYIMSGWKSAGILQAIRTGSANLESLDPFSDIDPLILKSRMRTKST